MSDKQSIAARIKALLQMTTANGCTEAEAMAAAEKARELMDKYQIDLTDAELRAEGVDTFSTGRGAMGHIYIADWLLMNVAKYCDCHGWRDRRGGAIRFFGLTSDAEFAKWLLDSLSAFVRRSAAAYAIAQRHRSKKERWVMQRSFAQGCIERINQRLEALIKERRAKAGTGRSLIVLKNAIVDPEFAKLGLKFEMKGGARRIKVHRNAWDEGTTAGDRASFGKPVQTNGPVGLIGRS